MSDIDRLTIALREAESLADPYLASKLMRATTELSSLRAEKDALDFASFQSSFAAADAAGALIVKTSAHLAESAAAAAAVAATVHARAISAAEAAVAADTVSLGTLLLDAHALVARAKALFFAAEREAAVDKARAEAISVERANFGIREAELRAAERSEADARVLAARSEEGAVTDQLRKDIASANSAAMAAVADEKARCDERLTAAIVEERTRFESHVSALRAEAELKQAEAVAKALQMSEEKAAIALAEERERFNLMLLEARREGAAPRSSPPAAAQAVVGFMSAASASEVAPLSLNSEEAVPSAAISASASTKKNARVRSMKARATPLETFPASGAAESGAVALDTRKRKPEGTTKGSRRLLKRANNSDMTSSSPIAAAPDSSVETTEMGASASALGESIQMADKKHRARRRPNHVVLDDDDDQDVLASAAPLVDSGAPSIAEPTQANERRAGRLSLRGALAEPVADLSAVVEAPIMRASGFKSVRPPLSSKGQENVMVESKGSKSLELPPPPPAIPAAPAFTIPVGTAWNRGFSSIGFKVPKLR